MRLVTNRWMPGKIQGIVHFRKRWFQYSMSNESFVKNRASSLEVRPTGTTVLCHSTLFWPGWLFRLCHLVRHCACRASRFAYFVLQIEGPQYNSSTSDYRRSPVSVHFTLSTVLRHICEHSIRHSLSCVWWPTDECLKLYAQVFNWTSNLRTPSRVLRKLCAAKFHNFREACQLVKFDHQLPDIPGINRHRLKAAGTEVIIGFELTLKILHQLRNVNDFWFPSSSIDWLYAFRLCWHKQVLPSSDNFKQSVAVRQHISYW